jgi:hypothetical protein
VPAGSSHASPSSAQLHSVSARCWTKVRSWTSSSFSSRCRAECGSPAQLCAGRCVPECWTGCQRTVQDRATPCGTQCCSQCWPEVLRRWRAKVPRWRSQLWPIALAFPALLLSAAPSSSPSAGARAWLSQLWLWPELFASQAPRGAFAGDRRHVPSGSAAALALLSLAPTVEADGSQATPSSSQCGASPAILVRHPVLDWRRRAWLVNANVW